MTNLTDLTLVEAANSVCKGEVSSYDLTKACLARREKLRCLNAYLPVSLDALQQAKERDRQLAEGRECGTLHGVPIGVKDLIDVKGVPTTAGLCTLKDNAVADA